MKIKKTISEARFAIHNKTFFKHFLYSLFFKRMKNKEKRESHKRKLYFNYKVNVNNPNSFNEFLLWIKYNYRNELWYTCADKLKCKEYLIQRGFEQFIPKTLGIYKHSSEIDLSKLPNKFLLKTNHDSGSIFVCEKGKTNFESVFKKLDESIKHNYAQTAYEWVYEKITPTIFAEEYLESADGSEEIADYKFFTFNGKFKFGYMAYNRSSDPRFVLFEKGLKYVTNCEYIHLKGKEKDWPKKPSAYDKMEQLAELVGSDFDFVRVDLYNTNKGPMIGELTFISMSGFGAFTKKEYDFKYGEYFKDTIFNSLANKKSD